MRKGVLRFCCAVGAAALLGALAPVPARADVAVVVLDGRGYGHGVGLSQWAARYMADAGRSTADILATFYPGTSLEQRSGTVRVAVLTSPTNQTVLAFPSGGAVHSGPPGAPDGPGFPVQVGPGGSVTVTFDGSYHVTPNVAAQSASEPVRWDPAGKNQACIPLVNCPTTTTTTPPGGGGGGGGGSGCGLLGCLTTTTTAPPDSTTNPPGGGGTTSPPTSGGGSTTAPPPGATGATSSSPVWAVPNGVTAVPARGRSYRGAIEATAGAGTLRLVNQLDVETYLRGMGEVPGSWPLAAIGAQTVAARTYALRAMAASGELCDYDLCQVYLGVGNESAGQNAAVDATQGQVVTFNGALAAAVYSAEAGGVSATTFEGFGTPDGAYPYLGTVHYDTPNPLPWHTEIAMSDVAARLAYPGTLSALTISQTGPSGRALEVALDGDAGRKAVTGRQFASRLGLRSTLFTAGTGSSAVAPPPPADAYGIQALPDDAAALTAAAAAAPSTDTDARRVTAAESKDAASRSVSVRSAARDLADEPATRVAVWLVAAITALGLARFGPDANWRSLRTATVHNERQMLKP